MKSGQWALRRIGASEKRLPLWHLISSVWAHRYVTACGHVQQVAGATIKSQTPAGACSRCLEIEAKTKGV